MPEFNAQEWSRETGEKKLKITSRQMVDIWVSCTKKVQVLGVPEAKGSAAVVLKSGEEFRFRSQVKGFQEIVIKGTGQTPFGLKLRHTPIQDGEENSGERPPVINLPEPGNLLLKMRQMSRDHFSQTRMPVLEPEEFTSFNRYEIDDDDAEVLFEEEAYAKSIEARKKADKERKEAEAKKAVEDAEGRKEPVAASDEPRDGEKPPEPAPQATAAE